MHLLSDNMKYIVFLIMPKIFIDLHGVISQAKKLLVGCAKVSCVEAESCGLVTKLIPEGELRQEVFMVSKEVLTLSTQVSHLFYLYHYVSG